MKYKVGDEVLISALDYRGFPFKNDKCVITEVIGPYYGDSIIRYRIIVCQEHNRECTITASWYDMKKIGNEYELPEDLFKI
jgi:hypothetical protein